MKIPIRTEQEKEMILQRMRKYIKEQTENQTENQTEDQTENQIKDQATDQTESKKEGFPRITEEKGIFFLKFQNKKRYHVWKLEIKSDKNNAQKLIASQEITFNRTKNILRDGYFVMIMIFANLVAFYMAAHKNLAGMIGFSAVGMVTLWLLLFSVTLNIVLPGKECRNFLYAKILNI